MQLVFRHFVPLNDSSVCDQMIEVHVFFLPGLPGLLFHAAIVVTSLPEETMKSDASLLGVSTFAMDQVQVCERSAGYHLRIRRGPYQQVHGHRWPGKCVGLSFGFGRMYPFHVWSL